MDSPPPATVRSGQAPTRRAGSTPAIAARPAEQVPQCCAPRRTLEARRGLAAPFRDLL